MKNTWLIVAVFALVQIGIIFFAANGPFVDEGICAVSGLRVLQGFGFSDGYIKWFNGSPFVWPVLSAIGYHVGGLEGSRLMAVAFSVATLLVVAQATQNLFGGLASEWATLALAANGLFVAQGHFAVYDAPSPFGLGLSLLCLTQFMQSNRRRWVVAAAVAYAFAVISKYAYVFMIVPLVGLLLVKRNRKAALGDVALFSCTSALLMAPYFLLFFKSLVPGSLNAYMGQTRVLDMLGMLQLLAYFNGLPLLLGVIGCAICVRSGQMRLAGPLFLALFIWPVFHLITLNHVSAQKHVVSGFIFAYPLVGLALETLWVSRGRWLVPAILILTATFGAKQWYGQEYSWPDIRPAANYLLQHVDRGDSIYTADVWPYLMYLYPAGLIDSPKSIYSQRGLARANLSFCDMKWLVGDDGGNPDADVVRASKLCGHGQVFRSPITRFPVRVAVYRLNP